MGLMSSFHLLLGLRPDDAEFWAAREISISIVEGFVKSHPA